MKQTQTSIPELQSLLMRKSQESASSFISKPSVSRVQSQIPNENLRQSEIKLTQKDVDELKAQHSKELKLLQLQLSMEQNLKKQEEYPSEEELEKIQNEFVLFKEKILDQQKKLEELELIKQKQSSMISDQEKKWSILMKKLEIDYQGKIKEFEEILKLSEEKTNLIDKSQKAIQKEKRPEEQALLDGLRKKLNDQKKVSQDKLKVHAEILKSKEQQLADFVNKEQDYQNEIQKKEELIGKFKHLMDNMNQEKEMILAENEKVRTCLNGLKDLLRQRLPQLGLDPNLFDQDDEDEQQAIEEEKQDDENSTEVEDQRG